MTSSEPGPSQAPAPRAPTIDPWLRITAERAPDNEVPTELSRQFPYFSIGGEVTMKRIPGLPLVPPPHAVQGSQNAQIPPILNDRITQLTHSDSKSDGMFTCFQRLPAEIRLKIWCHALQQRRHIRLNSKWCETVPRLKWHPFCFHLKNPLGKYVTGQAYSILPGVGEAWDSRRLPSGLMAVNMEARQAALDFYYLQIPATTDTMYYPDGTVYFSPKIYLNPDWDHVHLLPHRESDFLDFIYDTRAYDPKGVGIKHMIAYPYDMRHLVGEKFHLLQSTYYLNPDPAPLFFPSSAHPLQGWVGCRQADLVALLADLKTMTFMHVDADTSRLKLPWGPTDFQLRHERHELQPIHARPQGFELLDSDPRPGVSDALTTLWVKLNPLDARRNFVSFLDYIGVPPGSGPEIYHMVCVRPEWKRTDRTDRRIEHFVSDREDFVDLLRTDAAAPALDHSDYGYPFDASLGGPTLEGHAGTARQRLAHVKNFVAAQAESNERMGLPPVEVPDAPETERVAGFWLFKTEDFGRVKEKDGEMVRFNVSGAKPKLGVCKLPVKAAVK
ncbi:hypothetical protein CONLIGDRAFT_683823 [Coniochaeta ligniaria NRRL 30616]|uniref:2EXR domain-containing protein n=1 Tax=Coniochaeta ligniaria NRRL 30616 TaxID=1408157 RepID=A0A1J7JGW9_9PEZI|nr:hypothetical protein CONLIGDRAFT_683823 [Coniochaeta ligniaria NRRL 30616]